MQVKKSNLETFFKVLRATDGTLSLADSRIRDAFMKPLGEAVDNMVKEHLAILEKFCKKNEDGTPDTEGGNYKFAKEVQADADAELRTLQEEVVDVEYKWGVGPTKLKEIVENSPYKPSYGEVDIIDEIITAIV